MDTQKKLVETAASQAIADELIASRAYEKWQQRGCPLGEAEQDWFAARSELEQELGARPQASPNGRKSRK